MMKRVYRIFGFFIGIFATAAFTVYALRKLSADDLSRYMSCSVIVWLIIAALIYAAIIPISAWAWREMLSGVGLSKSWLELAMIMAVTQIAKYLPGNVGQYIGRTAMSLAHGINIRPYFSTVFVETLLTMLAALVIGLIGIAFSKVDIGVFKYGNATAFVIILIGFLTICLLSCRTLLSWLIKKLAPAYAHFKIDNLLPYPFTIFKAFAAYILNYLLIGFILWFLAVLLLPEIEHDFMLLLCSFSLAWFVGFFAPGAPAGLGVREVVMLGILATGYSGSDVIFLIVALRIATVLGDGICFLAGYILFISGKFSYPKNRQDAHS